jgi:uncharacterized protein (DUF433 family)
LTYRKAGKIKTGAYPCLKRITFDPKIMGGRPAICGLRVTAGTIIGLIAAGHDPKEMLEAYPYVEEEDTSWRRLTCSSGTIALEKQPSIQGLTRFGEIT